MFITKKRKREVEQKKYKNLKKCQKQHRRVLKGLGRKHKLQQIVGNGKGLERLGADVTNIIFNRMLCPKDRARLTTVSTSLRTPALLERVKGGRMWNARHTMSGRVQKEYEKRVADYVDSYNAVFYKNDHDFYTKHNRDKEIRYTLFDLRDTHKYGVHKGARAQTMILREFIRKSPFPLSNLISNTKLLRALQRRLNPDLYAVAHFDPIRHLEKVQLNHDQWVAEQEDVGYHLEEIQLKRDKWVAEHEEAEWHSCDCGCGGMDCFHNWIKKH